MPTRSSKPFNDEMDHGGRKLLRAKYIGCGNGPHQWLVYGYGGDTCGAVQISQIKTAGTKYEAWANGHFLGRRKNVRDAIALLLDERQRAEFSGVSVSQRGNVVRASSRRSGVDLRNFMKAEA
jgi:hypothetical protein